MGLKITSSPFYFIYRNIYFSTMVLVQKILDILNSMLTPETPEQGVEYLNTVIYDSGFSASVRVDRKPAPYAIFYLLSDWNIDLSKGTAVKEIANIQIFFADTANFDAKGEDKDVIVNRMEGLARDFIRRLLEDRSIKILDDTIKVQSTYGKFDKFLVGTTLNIKIEERQAQCL